MSTINSLANILSSSPISSIQSDVQQANSQQQAANPLAAFGPAYTIQLSQNALNATNGSNVTAASPSASTQQSAATVAANTPSAMPVHHHHHRHGGGQSTTSADSSSDSTSSSTTASATTDDSSLLSTALS